MWFLVFLFVPIIVHLFNFRKAKRIDFTNVRFIQKASSETKSKKRIKHVLILISRIGVVVFIIASFFLYFFDNKLENQDGLLENVFYLDNSISNYSNTSSKSLQLTEQLITDEAGMSGYLLTNDFNSFSNRPRPKVEMLDHLNELNVSFTDRPLKEVLDRMKEQTGDINLISDFQTAKIDDLDFIKADTFRTYQLVVNDFTSFYNVYIDSVWTERDIEDYGYNIINCVLGVSGSSKTASGIVVKLLSEGGEQVSSVIVDLGTTSKVNFSIPRLAKELRYTIEISGDDLDYDNEFYLTSSSGAMPSILLLSKSRNNYLENIFSNSELFDFVSLRANQIDYELIQGADLVILNEYYQLPQGLIEQNTDGLTFMVIPSDSVNLNSYTKELGMQLVSLSSGDYSDLIVNESSIFEGLFDNFKEGVQMPKGRNRYRIQSDADVLVKLRTSQPFLVKDMDRDTYFFAAPLTDEFTELPTHSAFLPLMYRIAESSLKMNQKLFLYPGDMMEVSTLVSDDPLKIVAKEIEVVPEFAIGNGTTVLKIPSYLKPGFYTIMQMDDTLASVSINLPKSESLFPEFTGEKISSFFKESRHVKVVSGADSYDETLYGEVSENSLWKYALVLALAFLLLETVLHKYLK